MTAVSEGTAASQADDAPAYERPVPGTVHLMTEEPVPIDEHRSAIGDRVAKAVNHRPWLIPVVLMAGGALFLLLRRRR